MEGWSGQLSVSPTERVVDYRMMMFFNRTIRFGLRRRRKGRSRTFRVARGVAINAGSGVGLGTPYPKSRVRFCERRERSGHDRLAIQDVIPGPALLRKGLREPRQLQMMRGGGKIDRLAERIGRRFDGGSQAGIAAGNRSGQMARHPCRKSDAIPPSAEHSP